jgi:hypothetical protein
MIPVDDVTAPGTLQPENRFSSVVACPQSSVEQLFTVTVSYPASVRNATKVSVTCETSGGAMTADMRSEFP